MIPRTYLNQVIGFTLAGVLWMTSLYQLEILWIWLATGRSTFEFPFYIWTTSLWMARDFWYAINGLAMFLAMASAATLGVKRTRRMIAAQSRRK